MKSILGTVVIFLLVLISGGVYLATRQADKRTSDWAAVKAVPTKMWGGVKAVGSYLKTLFTVKAGQAEIDSSTPAVKAA